MRTLAKQIITTAALQVGIPEASVLDEPKKQSILLPVPRCELFYLPEELIRSRRKIAKFPSAANPGQYRTVRSMLYERKFTVRVTVRSDDEESLSTLTNGIITAIPTKTADADNNLVVITASKAVRGGFGYRIAEPLIKRSNALYIIFTGMITKDEDIPMILDVNIKDNTSYR